MKTCLLTVLLWLTAASAQAATIAIIGTGTVGSALGMRFAEAGHTIVYGSRDPEGTEVLSLVARTGHGARASSQSGAAEAGEIVVLALPWRVTEQVVADLGDLSGKIIIDPINSFVVRQGQPLTLDTETSTAEEIQDWAPDARVVKAFNTVIAAFMRDPTAANGPITIPLAGDDADAKAVVAGLVDAIGLVPLDVGPLIHARPVEAMALLYVAQGMGGRPHFEFHLRPTDRPDR